MKSLRKQMDDAMVMRGFALRTRQSYLDAVKGLAKHYRLAPDMLSTQQVQDYFLQARNTRLLKNPLPLKISLFKETP